MPKEDSWPQMDFVRRHYATTLLHISLRLLAFFRVSRVPSQGRTNGQVHGNKADDAQSIEEPHSISVDF